MDRNMIPAGAPLSFTALARSRSPTHAKQCRLRLIVIGSVLLCVRLRTYDGYYDLHINRWIHMFFLDGGCICLRVVLHRKLLQSCGSCAPNNKLTMHPSVIFFCASHFSIFFFENFLFFNHGSTTNTRKNKNYIPICRPSSDDYKY